MDQEELNKILRQDLELALNLITSYQRALYTLNAPDPNVALARPLQRKYKILPHKQSDNYRVMVEHEGKMLEISDPDNPQNMGDRGKFATDYHTGRTVATEHPEEAFLHTVEVCPEHAVPLDEEGECHRCRFEHGYAS